MEAQSKNKKVKVNIKTKAIATSTSIEREVKLSMIWKQNIKDEKHYNLTSDYPVVMSIIESGWIKPMIYHVIIEDGEIGDSIYYRLTKKEIKEKFNINIDKLL